MEVSGEGCSPPKEDRYRSNTSSSPSGVLSPPPPPLPPDLWILSAPYTLRSSSSSFIKLNVFLQTGSTMGSSRSMVSSSRTAVRTPSSYRQRRGWLFEVFGQQDRHSVFASSPAESAVRVERQVLRRDVEHPFLPSGHQSLFGGLHDGRTFKITRGIFTAQLFRPGALSMHEFSSPGVL